MAKELFDESHYFMCAGGLKPCAFNAGQKIMKKETDEYYLVHQSLTTRNGDFSCRWMALLVAILAALIAVLCATGVGAVLVAAMIGAAAGAGGGMLLCGSKAAVARTWLVIKTDAQIGTKNMVVNKPGQHLTCAAFGQPITFLPNVTSEFHAMVLFAGNVGMTGLEGFMYAYATRGVGMLVTKPLTFFANFGVNYLRTLSVQGIAMRGAFGAWSGISAYSTSSTKMTVDEGLQNKEVWKEAGKGFGFSEMAAYRLTTQDYSTEQKAEGNEIIPKMYDDDGNEVFGGVNLPAWSNDALMLLSFGGIQGGKTTKQRGKLFREYKDASIRDVSKTSGYIKRGLNSPKKVIINDVKSIKSRALEFKANLASKTKKGQGAHEVGILSKEGKTAYQHAVEEMQKILDQYKNGEIGKRQKPNSLEVAVHKTTGEFIVGRNRGLRRRFGSQIKNKIHENTKEQFKESGNESHDKYNCSEADVVDQINHKNQNPKDYEYSAVEIDSKGEIQTKHTCRNCDINMIESIKNGDVKSNTPKSKAASDISKQDGNLRHIPNYEDNIDN